MTRNGNKAGWWLALLVLFLTGSVGSIHIRTWGAKLYFPGAFDPPEGIALAEMLHLQRGIPIYASRTPDRFDTANYGPLYYLLGAQLINAQHPTYLPIRMVSLLGLLGCAAGSALLAFLLTRNYLAATLAPLLFLAYGFVTRNGISGRCDMVALLLSFSGFLVAYRFQRSRILLWATPSLVLAIFYKQNFVAAPLSIFLFLLMERRYRLAAEFAGLLALGGLGLLVLFQFVVFRGQTFLDHSLLYNVLPFSWEHFSLGALLFGIAIFPPLLGAIAFLRSHSEKLPACYLGCAGVFSLAIVAREGSDLNYFLECALITNCLLAAWLIEKLSRGHSHEVLESLLVLGFVLYFGYLLTSSGPRPGDIERDRTTQEYLKRRFPPKSPALGWYPGDLARAGLETPITNIFHYTWLVRKGIFPEEDLASQIRNRHFALIVLNADIRNPKEAVWVDYYLTRRMQGAILANYYLDSTLDMPFAAKIHPEERFYAWVPRSDPVANGTGRE